MMKVEVYLPEEDVEKMVDVLHEAGYLIMGSYDHVYATQEVLGHWRPLEGSQAYEGSVGVISREKEVLLSFRANKNERETLEALVKTHHPYETPRIDFFELI